MTSFGVLGSLEAFQGSHVVPLKGPRHRTVLARLLIARGRVVPVGALADDVWSGAPPEGALAALRTFVADLRRALEPARPPRTPPTLLVTAPPGYALRAAPDAVDAWRFEAAVAGVSHPPAAALAALDEALALWRGPAYAEWSAEGWARAEIDRLDELRLHAVERRAAALLDLARPAEAVSALRPHAEAHPLREEAWRLLALALYHAGRQADALSSLRAARQALAAQQGLDPGPALRALETDILTQAPHLTPRPHPVAGAAGRGGLFGRDAELARLRAAAERAGQGRVPVVALVSGEAGAGKTAISQALSEELAGAGWTTAWARAAEHDGAPPAWPWAQIEAALGVEPSAAGSAFGLVHAAARLVTEAAGRAPVLIVADDLHRADGDTLELLAALPGMASGPVLLVATLRDGEPSAGLTAALARFARAEPVRVRLGGLSEAATGDLAREVVGRELGAPAVHLLHRRADGNPFFVRELGRLVADEGEAALRTVPAGVGDVIRHRLAQLSPATLDVLRRAAVLGRDVDPEVLAALSEDRDVLDALEEGVRAGFLTAAGGPAVRFAHVLVRDTLYADLTPPRRAAWHAAAGAALERLAPQDADALAHHFSTAATRATAPRAARYSARAAARAERRGNPHEAARLWRQSLTAHDRFPAAHDAFSTAGDRSSTSASSTAARDDSSTARDGSSTLSTAYGRSPTSSTAHGELLTAHDRLSDAGAEGDRLDAMVGLGRALAVIGHLDEARRLRADAVAAAERLGDVGRVAAVLGAFDVPAAWPRNDDEALSARIAAATERTLQRLTDAPGALRSRLLSVLALELRGAVDGRGARAAAEAERLARAGGDPALLALALNARYLHAFERPGRAGERAAIGAELIALAAANGLVTFEVLGRLVALQAACALDDRQAADRHAAEADALAERFGLPLVGIFTRWYAALRLARDGALDEAEAAYRAADEQLAGAGMPGMRAGLLGLALLSIGRRRDGDDLGPYEPWARPGLLLERGHRAEAAAALRSLPESPRDLLWEARLCLALDAARRLGDRAVASRLAERLRPAAAEHAAGSGVLSLGPVGERL